MSEPIFRAERDVFVPTGHARGPWDPDMQHGGAPSALLARAIEAAAPEMQLARLTVEFLGAVPLQPLTVQAEVWRPGRRMQLARASLALAGDGREMCRASAVLLHRQELEGLPGDGRPEPLTTAPEDGRVSEWAGDGGEAFYSTGMDMRWVVGDWSPGPGVVWFRLARPVVDDEEPSPAMRAAAAADFGNGVSQLLGFREWLFINTDLTMQLHRAPEGEWVGVDARTILQPGGVGLAVSTLHDVRGPVGTGQQTLYVGKR